MNKERVRFIVDQMQGGTFTLGVLEQFFESNPSEEAQNKRAALDVCTSMRSDGLSFDEAYEIVERNYGSGSADGAIAHTQVGTS